MTFPYKKIKDLSVPEKTILNWLKLFKNKSFIFKIMCHPSFSERCLKYILNRDDLSFNQDMWIKVEELCDKFPKLLNEELKINLSNFVPNSKYSIEVLDFYKKNYKKSLSLQETIDEFLKLIKNGDNVYYEIGNIDSVYKNHIEFKKIIAKYIEDDSDLINFLEDLDDASLGIDIIKNYKSDDWVYLIYNLKHSAILKEVFDFAVEHAKLNVKLKVFE